MNTKHLSVLLFAIIVFAAACTPVVKSDIADPALPAALVPVVGEKPAAAVERAAQEPRLWSGEIFLSDSNAPDNNIQEKELEMHPSAEEACMTADSDPRRFGGCVE